jgi:hypothetical protein
VLRMRQPRYFFLPFFFLVLVILMIFIACYLFVCNCIAMFLFFITF